MSGVTGRDDSTVRIWDWETSTCERTYSEHLRQYDSLHPVNLNRHHPLPLSYTALLLYLLSCPVT